MPRPESALNVKRTVGGATGLQTVSGRLSCVVLAVVDARLGVGGAAGVLVLGGPYGGVDVEASRLAVAVFAVRPVGVSPVAVAAAIGASVTPAAAAARGSLGGGRPGVA